jgi:integrase
VASLRKRRKVWFARLSVGRDPVTGRYVYKEFSTGQTSRREAEKVAAELDASLVRGIVPSTERTTVEEFMAKWLADYVRPNLDQSTAISYEGEIRLHIVPLLGGIPLRDLRPEQLARFYAAKTASLAQSHVLYLHRIIHKALNTAMRWSLVPRNVADAVDAPRVRREERPVLTEEQVGRLLDALRDDRLYSLYFLALDTGLREGELVARRWTDLDESSRTLLVRTKFERETGAGIIEGPTKARRPRSSVPLSEHALRVLRTHAGHQAEEKERAGTAYHDDGLIWCWEDGARYDPNWISGHFRRLRKRLGWPDVIHFHDLRHTSATMAIAKGEPLKVTQERLGHASPATTLAMYGHATPEMHGEAADRRGGLLGARDFAPKTSRRHRQGG